MAKITTYTAPIERLHPSDLGYTANIQLGRRLAGFATEQAAALRAGGTVEGQNILEQRRAAVALMDFLNPPTPRQARGGGGGGGGGGGSGRAAPQEVARGAAALGQALGGPTKSTSTSTTTGGDGGGYGGGGYGGGSSPTGKLYMIAPDRYPRRPFEAGYPLSSQDVSGEALSPVPGIAGSGYNTDQWGNPLKPLPSAQRVPEDFSGQQYGLGAPGGFRNLENLPQADGSFEYGPPADAAPQSGFWGWLSSIWGGPSAAAPAASADIPPPEPE